MAILNIILICYQTLKKIITMCNYQFLIHFYIIGIVRFGKNTINNGYCAPITLQLQVTFLLHI